MQHVISIMSTSSRGSKPSAPIDTPKQTVIRTRSGLPCAGLIRLNRRGQGRFTGIVQLSEPRRVLCPSGIQIGVEHHQPDISKNQIAYVAGHAGTKCVLFDLSFWSKLKEIPRYMQRQRHQKNNSGPSPTQPQHQLCSILRALQAIHRERCRPSAQR